jgi:hypothetical protein
VSAEPGTGALDDASVWAHGGSLARRPSPRPGLGPSAAADARGERCPPPARQAPARLLPGSSRGPGNERAGIALVRPPVLESGQRAADRLLGPAFRLAGQDWWPHGRRPRAGTRGCPPEDAACARPRSCRRQPRARLPSGSSLTGDHSWRCGASARRRQAAGPARAGADGGAPTCHRAAMAGHTTKWTNHKRQMLSHAT